MEGLQIVGEHMRKLGLAEAAEIAHCELYALLADRPQAFELCSDAIYIAVKEIERGARWPDAVVAARYYAVGHLLALLD